MSTKGPWCMSGHAPLLLAAGLGAVLGVAGLILKKKAAQKPTPPVTLVVTVEIEEARIPAFLEAMEIDAVGSRNEPGCMRFDVLKVQGTKNKFMFYEMYVDADAITYHKEQPHYKAWGDFKKAGGVISQEVLKADSVIVPYY
mmetsp:Transcript_99316/g.284125  ORF Transcript_99316/g.284125 Transcript_99316/m.284125 type:complete len:142 (+) Transcript_99316:121-546(+)|eukprot:CAMPEP_0119481160 /NCGR_PEP_ID=MMETSP1344-20130328/9637_1 /TAXON_ID=236787 /ORGANISM="Florenciella parvula, Strain CCMP2471" /LENGTH=141 /DNA_ID=CAMNT_0007515527 /DNA_START=114 /DNA_END=539 /DNA_ORIENTATION=+